MGSCHHTLPQASKHQNRPIANAVDHCFGDVVDRTILQNDTNGRETAARLVGQCADSDRPSKSTPPGLHSCVRCCRMATTDGPGNKASNEFVGCREALDSAIRRCPEAKYAQMAAAISFVLTSLQPMQGPEISAATELFVHGSRNSDFENGTHIRAPWDGWLRICDAFLSEDSEGNVRFSVFSMSCFLKGFRISGIDTSHKAIATACLIQTDLDEGLEYERRKAGTPPCRNGASTAFSSYAAKFWREHCRIARRSSLMLGPWALFAWKGKDYNKPKSDGSDIRGHGDELRRLEIVEIDDNWDEVRYRQ